jgi:hypothetical protein
MAGVAVTNHSDTPYSHENGDFARLERSIRTCREAAQQYAGQLEILSGVEIGEPLWHPENTRTVLGLGEYDVVLASVHGQLEDGVCVYLGDRELSGWSAARLDGYLRRYLSDLAEAAETADQRTSSSCPPTIPDAPAARANSATQRTTRLGSTGLCANASNANAWSASPAKIAVASSKRRWHVGRPRRKSSSSIAGKSS